MAGYDNERSQGDHRHRKDREKPYVFATIQALIADFVADVRNL